MSNNPLKRERANANIDSSTTEYDDWAKKLVARPIPQIGVPLNQLNQPAQPLDGVPANEGYDLDSAIGKFSWETIATGKHIPTIYRHGQKFCSIRMLEGSVLNDLLQVIPQEIYDSAKLTSYFITNAEAKLLTYINSWHCNSQYGGKSFSGQDLIVTLEESRMLYNYIQFAYDVLSSGGKNKDNDYSKCGFVRVNNDSLIPYTVLKDGQKSVPLFYFEGQTDILKEKAEPLSGWELAYLKICCKVQGVRKDLIAGDSLQVVKLADLRSYFPKRSTFEENCWPPPKPKSLLPKQQSISSTAFNTTTTVGGYYNNQHQPSNISSHHHLSMNNGPRIPNRIVPSNDNFLQPRSTSSSNMLRYVTTTSTTAINNSANSITSSTILPHNNSRTIQQQQPINSSYPVSVSVTSDGSNFVRINGNSITSAIATSSSVQQRPLASSSTSSATATSFTVNTPRGSSGLSLNSNNSITTTLSNGITIQLASPTTIAPNPTPTPSTRGTPELRRIRATKPPVDCDLSRLKSIAEHVDGGRPGAYNVRTMLVEGNTTVHCINSKPFQTDGYLLLLQDLMNKYFPNVSIYPTTVGVLQSIGVTTFLPNSSQIATLNNYGFTISRAWEAPLVNALEVVALLPRLKLLLTPKPTTLTRMASSSATPIQQQHHHSHQQQQYASPYPNNTSMRIAPANNLLRSNSSSGSGSNGYNNPNNPTISSANRGSYYYTNSSTLGHAAR